MLVVAKSVKGHEFMYSAKSAHQVPKASANQICKALNDANYRLTDNEVWFVHEVGPYDNAYVYGEFQSFSKRKGKIYERS